ncbi:MAG: IclR family transcriptional regulator [Lachnospiraceae bacterium]|nr:IclR family transcriptional regulator [Lachnospiraceae bacterium]
MIQSVQRISQILNLFRKYTSLSLKQIAEETGLAKSTVHGLVSSLKEENFLAQDPATHQYSLGLAIFELSSYYHTRKDLRSISIPFINELAKNLGMTVQLAILDKNQVVYLYKKTTAEFLVFSISTGLRLPFHCTATGKIIAAFLPEKERETLIDTHSYSALTPYSISEAETMKNTLTLARTNGYALDLNESELGLGGLAVPIFKSDQVIAGALSISFLSETYCPELLSRILTPLQSSANLISRKLGWLSYSL